MITIAECKIQCSLLDDEVEHDQWFNLNLPAVMPTLESLLNRTIYADQDALTASTDADGIVFNPALKLAALMLIGHWFEHRETSSPLALNETPMALDYLVKPYRRMQI